MVHLSLTSIESLSKPTSVLVTLAKDHNISDLYNLSSHSLRDIISTHLTTGACALSSSEVCIKLFRTFHSGAHSEETELYNQNISLLTLCIYALSKIACTIELCPLRRLVNNNIEFFANDSLSEKWRSISLYILKHGKMTELNRTSTGTGEKKINESWPQQISAELKEKIVKMFWQQTSISVLSVSTKNVFGIGKWVSWRALLNLTLLFVGFALKERPFALKKLYTGGSPSPRPQKKGRKKRFKD